MWIYDLLIFDFTISIFCYQLQISAHRLLCHSLVPSELCSSELLQYKSATQRKLDSYSAAGLIKILLRQLFTILALNDKRITWLAMLTRFFTLRIFACS